MGVADVGVTINGGIETRKMLSDLGELTESVAFEAVQDAAGIVADEVRGNLERNLAGSIHSTGDLESSLGITPVDVDKNGKINARVGFHGYDSKGVPNQLKARVMESGSSKQQAKPFFRPAVDSVRKQVRDEMEKIIHQGVRKVTKE